MRSCLFTLLLAATVLSGQQSGNAQGADVKKEMASHVKALTRSEFDALLAKPRRILILDVRRPDEIKDIGGFPVYLSVQIGELETSLAWIPKGRTIVTVSNHAVRAAQAADILVKNGYKVAGTVGAQTYEAEGGKLTKIVPSPPAASPN
jgi:rhodanese-related sulfurtransferase